jgi:hypothetical protein
VLSCHFLSVGIYAACSGTPGAAKAQSAWPQLQEISKVSPASAQYRLQYSSATAGSQLHEGWAHFLFSAMVASFFTHVRSCTWCSKIDVWDA